MSDPSELERIRQEYEGRQHDGRYSYLQAARLLELQQRERVMLQMLAGCGVRQLWGLRMLDLGCGRGDLLSRFVAYGADPARLFGIDLLPERIAEARRLVPHVNLGCGDAAHLPFRDRSFHIVSQFVVFSSIKDEAIRITVAEEMRRVLAGRGLILWYDLRLNSSNEAIAGIAQSEIRRLFPGYSCQCAKLTLAPPIARRLAPHSALLAQLLERVPFLQSHLFAVIRRP